MNLADYDRTCFNINHQVFSMIGLWSVYSIGWSLFTQCNGLRWPMRNTLSARTFLFFEDSQTDLVACLRLFRLRQLLPLAPFQPNGTCICWLGAHTPTASIKFLLFCGEMGSWKSVHSYGGCVNFIIRICSKCITGGWGQNSTKICTHTLNVKNAPAGGPFVRRAFPWERNPPP